MVKSKFVIKNRLGLHARPAAIFVKKANEYSSEVRIEKDGKKVNGKSITSLLMLACPFGTEITLEVEGEDEEEAFKELSKIIEEGFYEE
ncbi:MAG: HPr family phosphocarrier protein [Desulfobacterota bacterium]|nr:HPr family phosphocarrier protein [Thermodesulfobacteriota bacterium]MDW8001944.1 HPr family phosphocarrier protein [Deltaproteobacteria bacterium]